MFPFSFYNYCREWVHAIPVRKRSYLPTCSPNTDFEMDLIFHFMTMVVMSICTHTACSLLCLDY